MKSGTSTLQKSFCQAAEEALVVNHENATDTSSIIQNGLRSIYNTCFENAKQHFLYSMQTLWDSAWGKYANTGGQQSQAIAIVA